MNLLLNIQWFQEILGVKIHLCWSNRRFFQRFFSRNLKQKSWTKLNEHGQLKKINRSFEDSAVFVDKIVSVNQPQVNKIISIRLSINWIFFHISKHQMLSQGTLLPRYIYGESYAMVQSKRIATFQRDLGAAVCISHLWPFWESPNTLVKKHVGIQQNVKEREVSLFMRNWEIEV